MPGLTITVDLDARAVSLSFTLTLSQLEIAMPTLQELLQASRDLLAAVTTDEDADDAEIARLRAELATAQQNQADPATLQEISDNLAAAQAKMHPPAPPAPTP